MPSNNGEDLIRPQDTSGPSETLQAAVAEYNTRLVACWQCRTDLNDVAMNVIEAGRWFNSHQNEIAVSGGFKNTRTSFQDRMLGTFQSFERFVELMVAWETSKWRLAEAYTGIMAEGEDQVALHYELGEVVLPAAFPVMNPHGVLPADFATIVPR